MNQKPFLNILIAGLVCGCLAGCGRAKTPAPAESDSKTAERGEDQDGLSTLRALAEKGDAVAQAKLGLAYRFGDGVPQDNIEAAKWCGLAAERGSAAAQCLLGECYQGGEGVPQDYTKAAKWFQLSAEQGVAVAQRHLGQAYYFGRGVPVDYAMAAKWFRRAAEQGDAGAQTKLGVAYYSGKGVPQDYTEAFAWINLAAAQGVKGPAEFRETLLREMTPAQIKEGQRLSREYANKFVK